MDEHRWEVGVEGKAVADRIGIKYQQDHLADPAYIVGGTVANLEILRLAETADRLTERVQELELLAYDGPVRYNATAWRTKHAEQEEVMDLLRRERALLIELEKARTRILASIFETGGGCSAEDVRQVGELLMAVEALHLEASGGVQRPGGVPCACVLCRPEGVDIVMRTTVTGPSPTLDAEIDDALAHVASAIGRSGMPGNSLPPNEVGICRACGDEREIFEGRCHDCISANRRGKE